MKARKNNILTEDAQDHVPFFNKQGGQHSFFTGNDGGKNSGTVNKPVTVQRKCDQCEKEDEEVQKKDAPGIQRAEEGTADAPTPPAAQDTPGPVAAAPAGAHSIVEDTETPEKGQMRKTEFLNRLKEEVCNTVNQALSGTPFSADSCPYIRASFEKHQNSSAAQIQALVIRYAPGAALATNAEGLIQAMKARVYTAALQWVQNGGDMSSVSSLFTGAAAGIGSMISDVASGIGNMFFKSEPGATAQAQSPQAVMQSLGKGSPLEAGTRSKMEDAFGTGFSGVEIHTDSNAAQLSAGMNARAFTVGNHVAFASGEYKPGDPVGDALMAHELAHTLQQQGGAAQEQTKTTDQSQTNVLEEDADNSAVDAVARMHGMNTGEMTKESRPAMKSKLRLQRCSGCSTPAPAEKAMSQELIDSPVKTGKGRVINVRGEVNQNTMIQDLARIDILGTTGAPVDKIIDKKKTNVYEISVSATSFTEPWVLTKFNAIFPEGSETTMTKKSDPKLAELKALIAEYRTKHPDSFSKLQGHNMFASSCAGACIGTFNRGVQNLYGINTIDTSDMKDTAFGTIDEMKKKKFINVTGQIAATYPKEMSIPENNSDLTLGSSIAGEMNAIVQKEEDGVHPFLFSLGNGYHSISIIFYKNGGKTEILWRDQHWGEATDNQKPMTAEQVDEKIKAYLLMRAKSWARIYYNKKNDPDIDIYSNIPEGPKKEAAKKEAEASARNDLKINRYGKLLPVDNK